AVDWSYKLLSGGEQAVLRRLSTFAGVFSLESACAVAAEVGVDPAGVVEIVASLVAKSLLVATARDGEMDYRLTNIARAFRLEPLGPSGERAGARRRHAEQVLQLAEQAAAACGRLPSLEWLARHGSRLDDIRDALRWAFDGEAGAAALAVRLVVTAIPVWKQY